MKLLKKLKLLFHNGKKEILSKPISSVTALFLLVAWITQSDELLHLIDITIYEIIALSQLSSNISILPLALSLCALVYASLLSFNEKNKSYYTEYIGVYWKSVKLKDGSNMFHVEESPYCIHHKMKLENIKPFGYICASCGGGKAIKIDADRAINSRNLVQNMVDSKHDG